MSVVRAVAHVHSEWSDDAAWPLAALAAAFRRRRFDVVLMAEHSRGWTALRHRRYVDACAAASGEGVLLVPGVEYNDPDNVVHVPVWGDVPFQGEAPEIARLLPAVASAGGVSVFAHPWRRDAWRRYELGWSEHLTAIEVWNRKYDGWAPDRRAVELAARERLPVVVALDFHTRRQFFPLALRLELASPATGCDAVYAALRARAFKPLAFGRPARPVTRGARLRSLEGAERARKVAARQLRRLTG